MHSRITLSVARVTAFETNTGTATDVVTRGRGERQAAVNPMTLWVEAERLC